MFISQNESFHNSSGDDSTYFFGPSNNCPLSRNTTALARSISRSQQDSGIDADNVSVSSAILNDYLQQIGIQPNNLKLANQNTKLELKKKKKLYNTDSELNELMYAKVDEIVGPGPLYRESDLLTQNSTLFLNVSF